ncbi:hypothetical protein RN001_008728 [Aquatica leii]|uniref:Uncharacterized protein n=1 Tax=Aquatica leii TaxID=1421715 RepID=A0AAN7PZE9_9COLE|nr:hypothetical protein RN001_008728 [Aquatica leii]
MDVRFIKLHYGPYEYNGFIRHRTQRLHGVIHCLTKLGYQIEIVPSLHINRLFIEISGKTIYSCNIQHLSFNMEFDDDVCKNITKAVEEASRRIFHDKNVSFYSPASKGMKAIQAINDATKTADYLDDNVKLWFEIPKPIDPVKEFEEYSFPFLHLN